MQKLLKRSSLAQRQAARKLEAQRTRLAKVQAQQQKNENLQRERAQRKVERAEKIARREDWVKGHLAPRRDVGEEGAKYGTLDVAALQGKIVQRNTKKSKERARKEESGIVVGDRVVVVEEGHRDMGKIGKVTELRKDRQEVLVEAMNRVSVAVFFAYCQFHGSKGLDGLSHVQEGLTGINPGQRRSPHLDGIH